MAKNNIHQSIISVERALAELRRGQPVVVQSTNTKTLVWAAEAVIPKNFPQASATLLLTANRAKALWPGKKFSGVVSIAIKRVQLSSVPALIGTSAGSTKSFKPETLKSDATALELTKLAEMAPAAVVVKNPSAKLLANVLVVKAADIKAYEKNYAMALEKVAEAPLTLVASRTAKIVGFRAPASGKEHYAIVVGSPKKSGAPLVRVHSSCYTGDLLASLKCDCRDQLQDALHYMAENGGGVLLYLMQEGRGIGLINKLRAYALQAKGMDTVEANEALGFEDDERPFLAASQMLKQLGFKKVRLMTNNPRKVKGLEACGIKVVERVDHVITPHEHNEQYLKTKFSRLGHVRK